MNYRYNGYVQHDLGYRKYNQKLHDKTIEDVCNWYYVYQELLDDNVGSRIPHAGKYKIVKSHVDYN